MLWNNEFPIERCSLLNLQICQNKIYLDLWGAPVNDYAQKWLDAWTIFPEAHTGFQPSSLNNEMVLRAKASAHSEVTSEEWEFQGMEEFRTAVVESFYFWTEGSVVFPIKSLVGSRTMIHFVGIFEISRLEWRPHCCPMTYQPRTKRETKIYMSSTLWRSLKG